MRFVVLHHQMPASFSRRDHWDLMLEADGSLRTWALDEPPQLGETIQGMPLADHRLAYLDYEGPISGNRGTVASFDRGSYATLEQHDGRWRVRLEGAALRCTLTIERCDADDQRCTFRFSADALSSA
jgi:hypothetical protein